MPNQHKKRGKTTSGRPRKFSEPSRPITVTLADRTLRLLESVDHDRAKAITKVTDAVMPATAGSSRNVELVEVEKGLALIVVGSSTQLRNIPWLRLVEISPANHILVLQSGVPIERLEVALDDMIERTPNLTAYERGLLNDLHMCLARLRRGNKMSKSEIIFVET
jgi:hypothetical protein